jgi:hypothetical protein
MLTSKNNSMANIKVKYVYKDLTKPQNSRDFAYFNTKIKGYLIGSVATEELVIDFALEHPKQIVGHDEVHIVSVNHFEE